MKKPYADDWVKVRDDLEYSPRLQLYWHKGRVYDQLSASHNGIIGAGHQLKEVIRHDHSHLCGRNPGP